MTLPTNLFRAALGLIALLGGLAGLAGLFFVPVPEANREPLLLALGLVLGWGSTVIGYEFGSSPAGRKAAEAGIRPTTLSRPAGEGGSRAAAEG